MSGFGRCKLDCWPGPQFSWTLSDFVTHEPRERPLFVGRRPMRSRCTTCGMRGASP